MNRDPLSICLTIDNNYVQHAAVTLTSLCVNNAHLHFNVIIVHSDISPKNRLLLIKEMSKYKVTIDFIAIDEQLLSDAILSYHFTIAIYYRLLLPKILPNNLDAILYLDADLIIRKDISDILNTDCIKEYSHAAVENVLTTNETKDRLNMPNKSKYFNAGLMIINLKYWREKEIMQKTLLFLKHNKEKIKLGDQDVLNAVLCNQWHRLPYIWNAQESFYLEKYTFSDLEITEKEHQNIVHNPTIVHFTGSDKPWYKENQHPFKAEYYKYLACTHWRNVRPQKRYPSLYEKIIIRLKKYALKLNKTIQLDA